MGLSTAAVAVALLAVMALASPVHAGHCPAAPGGWTSQEEVDPSTGNTNCWYYDFNGRNQLTVDAQEARCANSIPGAHLTWWSNLNEYKRWSAWATSPAGPGTWSNWNSAQVGINGAYMGLRRTANPSPATNHIPSQWIYTSGEPVPADFVPRCPGRYNGPTLSILDDYTCANDGNSNPKFSDDAWTGGEPTAGANEPCIHISGSGILASGGTTGLNDIWCNAESAYLTRTMCKVAIPGDGISCGCLNGGTCDPATGECDCSTANGWTGPTCENAPTFHCSPVCQNFGSCVDTDPTPTCDCSGTGFTGPTCTEEAPDCDPPCENGGVCGAGGACDCSATDFVGAACDECNADIKFVNSLAQWVSRTPNGEPPIMTLEGTAYYRLDNPPASYECPASA